MTYHIFESLDVTRTPVVHQHHAENMVVGLADFNRLTESVSLTYKECLNAFFKKAVILMFFVYPMAYHLHFIIHLFANTI